MNPYFWEINNENDTHDMIYLYTHGMILGRGVVRCPRVPENAGYNDNVVEFGRDG